MPDESVSQAGMHVGLLYSPQTDFSSFFQSWHEHENKIWKQIQSGYNRMLHLVIELNLYSMAFTTVLQALKRKKYWHRVFPTNTNRIGKIRRRPSLWPVLAALLRQLKNWEMGKKIVYKCPAATVTPAGNWSTLFKTCAISLFATATTLFHFKELSQTKKLTCVWSVSFFFPCCKCHWLIVY